MPKRVEGRIGEPQEYVEFQTKKANYVAQEAGGSWYVFRVGRGKDESLRTILGPVTRDSAVAGAEAAANAGA